MTKKDILNVILLLTITFTLTAQKANMDTLYFKFNKKYIKRGEVNKNQYYLKDKSNEGDLFFIKRSILDNLKPKEVLCFKKFIRSSKYYNFSKKKNQRLDGYRLWEYLDKYIIFFILNIDGRHVYEEVKINYVIE
ncbi:hypothetical protein [Algibacter sp. R77976]|uniref:hypothetical protein n=1 Tax=Algibacter sp. R77976 TaxID=3093873 RepID=UPI0037CA9CD0